MPLVDPATWFPSDSGDALPTKRRPQQAHGFTDPTFSYAIPATVPPGAPSWDVQPPARVQPRTWRASAEIAAPPSPLAVGALAYGWPDTTVTLRRRPWQPAQDAPGQALVPMGLLTTLPEQIAAQQPDDVLRRASPARRVSTEPGFPSFQFIVDPIPLRFTDSGASLLRRPTRLLHDAGRPPLMDLGLLLPPLSWDARGATFRVARRFVLSQELAAPPSVGVTDIPVSLVGWRDNTPPLRRRVPGFRAQEIDTLPAQAVFVELARFYAALFAPQADLVRARHWQPAPPDTQAGAIWKASYDTEDHLGHLVWDQRQSYPRLPRRTAWTDRGTAPILDASLQSVPWLPAGDGSRQASRAGRQPAGGPTLGLRDTHGVEWAWAGTSAFVVAGPFYCVAGQMWQAGVVDGQVESAD